MQRFLFIITIVSLSLQGFGQNTYERLISNGKVEKLEEKLFKKYAKDSLDVAVNYYLSVLYSDPIYPQYDLDTAYDLINRTIDIYQQIGDQELDRLERKEITEEQILAQKRRIDSVSFRIAKKLDTEFAYQQFLDKRPGSLFEDLAVSLRNQRAFEKAEEVNTYQAFKHFMEKYPAASQVQLARDLFHARLFEQEIPNETLEEYQLFVEKYPGSPYIAQAYQRILLLKLRLFTPVNAKWIVENYPNHRIATQASHLLFHWATGIRDSLFAYPLELPDSLQQLRSYDEMVLMPYYNFGKYGIVSENGDKILGLRYDSLLNQCAFTNYFWVRKGGTEYLMGYEDNIIDEGNFESVTDIGFGWLQVESQKGAYLIHKSGKHRHPSIDQAKTDREGRFIMVKRKDKWGILSFLGEWLQEPQFDSIRVLRDQLILRMNDRDALMQIPQLLKRNVDDLQFHDQIVEQAGILVVADGQSRKLLTAEGSLLFSADNIEELEKDKSGWIAHFDNDKLQLVGTDGSIYPDQPVKKMEIFRDHFLFKQDSNWWITTEEFEVVEDSIDSLRFFQHNFVRIYRDSLSFLFFCAATRAVDSATRVSPIVSPNGNIAFLRLQKGDTLTVVDPAGKEWYYQTGPIRSIEALGEKALKVQLENKSLLVTEFMNREIEKGTSFASGPSETIAILKDGQFGMYDPNQNVLIAPSSQKLIRPYRTAGYVIADEKGSGLFRNDSIWLEPAYAEIRYYNDSVCLARATSGSWMLIDIDKQDTLLQQIISFDILGDGKLKYRKASGYGLYDNLQSRTPAIFTEIEKTVWNGKEIIFGWQYLQEAGLYVRILYNHRLEKIFSEAFRPENYDRINCLD